MNRRDFIKLSGSGLIAAAAGIASARVARSPMDEAMARRLLEPVDLLARIRLGQNALLGGLDSGRRHLPYWRCDFNHGDLRSFSHDDYQGYAVWDRLHDVSRALHGLSMAESVTGESVSPDIIRDLADYQIGLFKAGDGLPGDVETATGKRFVNLHNVRESLNGLTALMKRGHPGAEPLARQMVRTIRRSLDDEGRIHLDRLPPYVGGYSEQPAMEGRAVDALVRYYRVSRDAAALETAALITRFALDNCFTEAGTLTEVAGTHGHSINVLVAGMIDLALATNDSVLLERARRAYDVGLPRFNTSFGWSMESLHKFRLRGEANNTGDLLRASLLLGKAGFSEYYGRAEKILRSQLLPSQAIDVEHYSDNPAAAEDRLRSLASRVRGGFSLPTPNDLQFGPDTPIFTYDVTSGAVDALCETYRSVVQEDASDVRVQLLLSVQTKDLDVASSLSGKGTVRIDNRSARNVWVRIPTWVRPSDVSVQAGGAGMQKRFIGPYLLLSGAEGAHAVTIQFPMREERTVESIVYQLFTIDWKGDQIVAMSPPAVPNRSAEPLPKPGILMFPPCN